MAGEQREGIRPQGVAIADLDTLELLAQLYESEILVSTVSRVDRTPAALFLVSPNSSSISDLISIPLGIITTVTASTVTLDHSYHTVLCDTSSNAITVNLPAAADYPGKIFTIKKIDATNNVVIDGNASETIDGATTVTLSTQYQSRTVQSDGSNWFIIASV